ncbi:DUF1007 family protein [Roseovarius salis]|uniref:DUF1007 family protein n=1 Tax=Roseovarius salis TaxID=3376063 RepID=UPI0037C53021
MIRRLLIAAAAAAAGLAAPVARAHPHVFVEVGLRLEADERGHLTGVEVTWTYDALYTLLILSDRWLDPDGDMVLTAAERAELLGFDLVDWPEGFEGALFIDTPVGSISPSPPEALSVRLEEGRLVTRHRRPLGPVAAPRLEVRPYDPSYYAALELSGAVRLPEGCTGDVVAPDRAAADARVAALGDPGREDFFEEVAVGVHYADTLVVTCAPSS